jgi:hypothetical protein
MIKRISLILLLIIVSFACYLIYNKQKTIDLELATLKQNIANQSDKEQDYGYMDKMGVIEKYAGEVLQIGGVGSRFNQITAYFLTEHGYIKPAEDWIKVDFNGAADILYVTCKDSYTISQCEVNGNIENIDEDFGCISRIENKMQNMTRIECKKN